MRRFPTIDWPVVTPSAAEPSGILTRSSIILKQGEAPRTAGGIMGTTAMLSEVHPWTAAKRLSPFGIAC